MIKVENIETWGFGHAVRGMRNPLNSWSKSDSSFEHETIGENDLSLMKKLYKAGSEHRKYARQIFVSMDITAPLYWWKEFDTYKIGTTTNSCSTMHKIAEKEFTFGDFSCNKLFLGDCPSYEFTDGEGFDNRIDDISALGVLEIVIEALNHYREMYLKTKDKQYWWQLIQLLPSSYNQKRTVTMTYENAFNIIRQRTGHKLDEWNEFVEIIKALPYVKEITE